VLGVAAEFEDVRLGDAQVLEKLPGRVGRAAGLEAAQRLGEIAEGVFKIDMGARGVEEFEEVVAEAGEVRGG
jgi:hypothetical protein